MAQVINAHVINAHVINYRGLYNAYRDCRCGKRHTANAQRYDMALLDNLQQTLITLQQRSYSPTRSIRFIAKKPKMREIHAADFSDRVVHHWLVPRLEKIINPIFIHDLYSNRKTKGTHKAIQRLQGFMHSYQTRAALSALDVAKVTSDNINKTKVNKGYYLQLDIANFFNCIDKPVLFQLLQAHIKKAFRRRKITGEEAQTLRWLCHVLLKHDSAANAQYRGDRALLNNLPAHKQLATASKQNKGLPIGNLTSQFFANVYLNPLDQYIKHQLKCQHYIRYVDDFILLAQSQQTLLQWRTQIQHFLHTQLQLDLKEIASPKPIKSGANFLGYIIYPHYKLVRRRVIGNLHSKLKHFQRQLIHGDSAQGYTLLLKPSIIQGLQATLASYWGHFKHANSYRLWQGLLFRFPWLALVFDATALLANKTMGNVAAVSIIPSWQPKPAQILGYKSQIHFFQQLFPCANLVVQRGTELDKFDSIEAAKNISLNLGNNDGYYHIKSFVRYLSVKENGYLKGGLKRRCIHYLTIQPGVELCH